jgi:patatin-related protein
MYPADPDRSFDLKQEVRFAVVIYGGVSLAIYINGIAQELLHLVRATAPDKPGGALRFRQEELSGSARVYRKLARTLGCKRPPAEVYEDIKNGKTLPVSARFVIDVLSGTSAGGINAVFLSKALVNNQSLENLKNLWVTEGDIDKLINDRNSLEPPLTAQRPPKSLLNSQRMYSKLLDALTNMDSDHNPSRGGGALVDELDLFTTATDIRGVELPLRLSDKRVDERRHRNVFHFRYCGAYRSCPNKASNGGPPEFNGNDFEFDDNPFLAFAARCTSAFPFAFEPMALADIFPVLQSNENYSGKQYLKADTRQWQRFYMDYIGDSSLEFMQRPFGDGGYLDNKPFSYAVDTMLKRFPTTRVERKLLYVEPSPEARSAPPPKDKPDAFENSLAALLTLPRYETIRQDLERILQRNRRVRNVNSVILQLRNIFADSISEELINDEKWRKSEPKTHGVHYAAYQELKTTTVIEELAECIMTAFHLDSDSSYGRVVRLLARLYFDRLTATRDPKQTCEAKNQFLLDFDRSFRVRRLAYMRLQIDEMCRQKEPGPFLDELSKIRRVLMERFLKLIQMDIGCDFDTSGIWLDPRDIDFILEPPSDCAGAGYEGLTAEDYPSRCFADDEGMRSRAKYLLDKKALNQTLADVANRVKQRFNFKDFSKPIEDTLKPITAPAGVELTEEEQARNRARETLKRIYKHFELCDSILFPIQYGADMGETDEIDIFRISPRDAESRGPHVLKGESFGAFGAFLDREWRKHDIVWGRLDGAERLISALLPGTDEQVTAMRRELVSEAQIAILEEELPALQADKQMKELADPELLPAIRQGSLSPEQKSRLERVLDPVVQFEEYLKRVPADPDPKLFSGALARSTTIAGYLLDTKAQQAHFNRRPFRILAMLGRVAWSLIEAASPRSFSELLFRYLYQVALLCALGLLLIGLTVQPAVAPIAAVLFGILLVLRLVVMILGRRFGRSDYWSGSVGPAGVFVISAILLSFGLQKTLDREGAFWTTGLVVLAALTALCSVLIWRKQRHLTAVQQGSKLPSSPISRLEFARCPADIAAVAGPFGHSNRGVIEQINTIDAGLAISYGLLFLTLGAMLGQAHPLGWIACLGALAGIADLFENSRIDAMLFEGGAGFKSPRRWAYFKFALLAFATAAAGLVLVSGAPVAQAKGIAGWAWLWVAGAAFALSSAVTFLGLITHQFLTVAARVKPKPAEKKPTWVRRGIVACGNLGSSVLELAAWPAQPLIGLGMLLLAVGLLVVTGVALTHADLLSNEVDPLRIVKYLRSVMGV